MPVPRTLLIALLTLGAPAVARAQADTAAPRVELTLADAEQRARDHHPGLRQVALDAEIADYAVAQARSAFTPTLTTTVEQRSQTAAGTSQLTGGTTVTTGVTSYNAGLTQALPWGGGRVALDLSNGRTTTTNLFSLFNPNYVSTLNGVFTQPLLRGFRIDGTRAQVQSAQLARAIAGVRLTRQQATTLAAVRKAYWELVYAADALDTTRASESLAQQQLEETRLRVELGSLAPTDVLQAESEVASRAQTRVQAEGAWRGAMVTLKQLIVGDTGDPLWRADLVAVDRPGPVAAPVDVDAAIQTARASRTDIREARYDRAGAGLSLQLAEDERRWQADLVAGFTATGVGGTRILRDNALGGAAVGTVAGGYLDALTSLGAFTYPAWRVGVTVSVPVGASRADAQAASARAAQRQADARIQTIELQLAGDLTRAAERVRSTAQQMATADTSRRLARQRLDAEDARLRVGLSTTFLVLQAQRDLAAADTSALRAALDHRIALVDFDLAQAAP